MNKGQKSESSERWKQTRVALNLVTQGRVIAGDVIHAWLASWGNSDELPVPKISEQPCFIHTKLPAFEAMMEMTKIGTRASEAALRS